MKKDNFQTYVYDWNRDWTLTPLLVVDVVLPVGQVSESMVVSSTAAHVETSQTRSSER